MDATTIRRLHVALNQARNEQQKFLLLAYDAQQQPPTSPPARTGSIEELVSHSCQVGINTLAVDVELALTFANIALLSGNQSQKRSRNRENARHAFDSIVRMRRRLELPEKFAQWLDDKLTLLKTALEKLGETF